MLLTQNPVRAGGMHSFYNWIKARSMPSVLPWTLNNILEGTKKGSCSGCDEDNTHSEMHVPWQFFGQGWRATEKKPGSVNARDTKKKALKGASHRCLINAFDLTEWSKCDVSVRQFQHHCLGRPLAVQILAYLEVWTIRKDAIPLGLLWMGSQFSCLSHAPFF